MALRDNRSVRGRELLWMILDYYKTNITAERIYTINDLREVKLDDPKNGNLEKFQNDWDFVLSCLIRDVDDADKEFIYYEAIKKHTKIATEISHYQRIEDERPPHKDRCFDYLYKTVNRLLSREQKERMREANAAAIKNLSAGKQPPPRYDPALAGKGEGKGKRRGKSRQRGKSRDRSKSQGRGGSKTRGRKMCEYHKRGACRYGENCRNSHGSTSRGSSRGSKGSKGSRTSQRSGGSNRSSRSGGSGKPDKKKPLTDAQKAKIACRNYKKGKCRFGDSCKYMHSVPSAPGTPRGGKDTPRHKKSKKDKSRSGSEDSKGNKKKGKGW